MRSDDRRAVTTIELTEGVAHAVARDKLPMSTGIQLWREYGEKLQVEFPTVATGEQWRLTSLGWIGYLPLTAEVHLSLRPKMPLPNVFGMLAYVYGLESLQLFDGLADCRSLQEVYEGLAGVLAQRVLGRSQQGLHQTYLARSERLTAVRGRIAMERAWRTQAVAGLECDYEEQTADIEDNQLLAWTLGCIARSGVCTERTLPLVRQAYRALPVSRRIFTAADCGGRAYSRLNQDYEPLHALCRFFLEHSGPAEGPGEQPMLPFLVHMPRLFEQFVAAWLRRHLPPAWSLSAQEQIQVGADEELRFHVDLVLDDGRGRCLVLDTKYKAAERPAAADVHQVLAYAKLRGATEACLVYPAALGRALDVEVGGLRLRTLPFDLGGELEASGAEFLELVIER